MMEIPLFVKFCAFNNFLIETHHKRKDYFQNFNLF